MRRQLTEWEKIFANEATVKGLISKIDKYLTQLYMKKTKQPKQKNRQKTSKGFSPKKTDRCPKST